MQPYIYSPAPPDQQWRRYQAPHHRDRGGELTSDVLDPIDWPALVERVPRLGELLEQAKSYRATATEYGGRYCQAAAVRSLVQSIEWVAGPKISAEAGLFTVVGTLGAVDVAAEAILGVLPPCPDGCPVCAEHERRQQEESRQAYEAAKPWWQGCDARSRPRWWSKF